MKELNLTKQDRRRRVSDVGVRESEKRLMAFVTATSDVVYRMSPDWSEMWYLQGRDFLRDTKEPNRTWLQTYIHPKDQPRMRAAIDKAIQTKRPFELEHQVLRVDGSLGWTFSRAVPIFNGDGAIGEWFGVASDVTDRKRAEEAVRESEEKYRTLFHSIDEGFCVIEVLFDDADRPIDYRFLDANPSFERQTGIKNPIGRRIREIAPEHEAHWFETYGRIARTGESFRFQNSARQLNRYYDVYAFRFGAPEERKVGVLFKDIAPQKKAEESLRRANEQLTRLTNELESQVRERTALAEGRARKLRELSLALSAAEQKERDRLARVLHDDLQQVLIAAKLKVQVVASEAVDGQIEAIVREADEALNEAVRTSRAITRDLSPPILRNADFGVVAVWMADQFKRSHGFSVHLNNQMGTLALPFGTRTVLYSALRELFLNTIKHAGTKELFLDIGASEKGMARICVRDEGRGFDPSHINREKSGFGLFNIRERIEAVGGEFEIQSRPGAGARFTFRLPLETRPRSVTTGSGDRQRSEATGGSGGDDRPIRVLVVDDHNMVRAGLVTSLQGSPGILIAGEAGDGRDAIQLAKKLKPDVILMDVNMPVMNGVEATYRITENDPSVRVIGLSFHTADEMASSMIAAGASAYVSKDKPVDDLVSVITEIFHGATSARETPSQSIS